MHICIVARGISIPLVSLINVEITNLQKNISNQGYKVDIIVPDHKSIVSNNHSFIKTSKKHFPKNNRIYQAINEIVFGFQALKTLNKLRPTKHYNIIQFYSPLPLFIYNGKEPCIFFCGTPIYKMPSLRKFGFTKAPKYQLLIDYLSIFFHKVAFKKAVTVVVNSESLKKNIIRYYNLQESKVIVIPGGVDTEYFCPQPDNEIRKKYGYSSNIVILMVASIDPNKNQKLLIEALPNLVKTYNNIKVLFAGPIVDSEYHKLLEKEISLKNLEKNIDFLGNLPHSTVRDLYVLADIVLLLSKAEGFSRVLLESMSSGKAIIASNIPENLEAVKCGSELLLTNLNKADLTSSILKITENSTIKKNLEQMARSTAVQYFDWKITTEQYISVYKEMSRLENK